MRQKEEVEVKYCDICGKREDQTTTVSKCWACGKDACSQHYHLNMTKNEKRFTYLCERCDQEMGSKLDVLFEQYRQQAV